MSAVGPRPHAVAHNEQYRRLVPGTMLRHKVQPGITGWTQVNKKAQAKVRIRLKRLEAGIFGDCKPVGDGVLELREHLGAGYRVYFGRHGLSIVILLCGGSKRTQATDIKIAKSYWADWKRRQA